MGKTTTTPKKKITSKRPSKQTSKAATGAAVAVAERDVSEEDVRRRAYEIFLATGARPGDDLHHWLEAERQLRG